VAGVGGRDQHALFAGQAARLADVEEAFDLGAPDNADIRA
jgi:hypothetical protein